MGWCSKNKDLCGSGDRAGGKEAETNMRNSKRKESGKQR